MQLQNLSLTFFHKNKSLLSTSRFLSRSPMAYKTTASLDKLTCTDYVDFGKYQDRIEQFSWSKTIPNFERKTQSISKKMTTKSTVWSKILQWERQMSTSL